MKTNTDFTKLIVAVTAGACLFTIIDRAEATTFYDNLSAATGSTEPVTSTDWSGAQFTTDASTYTSVTATLLMKQTASGAATLKLYSDGGLQPDSLLGTFTSPEAYSSTLSQATFTISGVSLAASTDYWIVLSAPSGSYSWAWTSDFSVMQSWVDSSNSGATWFAYNVYPPKYRVVSGIQRVGDYNSNGVIDAADYVVWRKQSGQTGSSLAADGDLSGTVDAVDYKLWRSSFALGSSAGSAAALVLSSGTVPEPATTATGIVVFAALTFILRRR